MNKLNITLCIFLISSSLPSFAQEVKLSDLLNEESKLTLAKQRSEIDKINTTKTPNLQLPSTSGMGLVLPTVSSQPVRKVSVEPQTISIFGIAPNYRAEMIINDKAYIVSRGDKIQSYFVASISTEGVLLATTSSTKSSAKKSYSKSIRPAPISAPKKKVAVKKTVSPTTSSSNTSKMVNRFYPLKPEQ